MRYKWRNINQNHNGCYIDSPDWIKKQKATMNFINDDDKCFQYASTVALKHKDLGKICKEHQK